MNLRILLAAPLLWASSPGARQPDVSHALTPARAAQSSNAFGFDLYGPVNVDHQNVIYSPASAAVALGMVSAGARGQTRTEVARVLHLDADAMEAAHASFGSLLGTLNGRNGREGVVLHVADRIWGQQGLVWKDAFLRVLKDQYRVGWEPVDFARGAAGVVEEINRWAARQTRDRISRILDPGALGPKTRLVVTNAVYFKGAWVDPFAPDATRQASFVTPGGLASARFMSKESVLRYAELDDLKVLEVPYRGGLSMLVVLPNDPRGLPAVEARLARGYPRWAGALAPETVELLLPRWKTESTHKLADKLQRLGMSRAFGSADFSGMTDATIFISEVIQKVFIEVTESGTEAAAVTMVALEGGRDVAGERPEPKVFHADHPFLYFIRDQGTGAILFLGHVVDPRG